MRSALHSHSIQDEVQAYNSLGAEIATSGATYTAFTASIHHVDPTAGAGYEPGEPATSNSNAHHEHMKHNGLHLDPNLSPDGPSSIGRQMLPSSSPLQQQQQHDFSNESPTASRAQHIHHSIPPHIPNSALPGHFDMLPPPPSTHPSWQALHEYAQSHASAHGYALSINTTAKNRSRIKLACVCYGQPKNTHKLTPETRVRKNRVSYKTGCKMWIEGKKQEDGSWMLRVGEPVHNHPGRAMEGWAVQRKRTWGVQGGRIGVGGVTAKEEQERLNNNMNPEPGSKDEAEIPLPQEEPITQTQSATHSLERGGLVWKIVEQEMMRQGGPGQGRDRGVGRTVKVLEERLPGIHIFKRDVYNIRAQIKRARRAAGQEIGEGLNESEHEDADAEDMEMDTAPAIHQQRRQHQQHRHAQQHDRVDPSVSSLQTDNRTFASQIDPSLIEQCNSALKSMPQQQQQQVEESEIERLRREVLELRKLLGDKTKELEAKCSENESLRVQVELANMALYDERRGLVGQ